MVLTTMRVQAAKFNILKELYAKDPYFSKIFTEAESGKSAEFQVREGFPFKSVQLCIPHCSLRKKLSRSYTVNGISIEINHSR